MFIRTGRSGTLTIASFFFLLLCFFFCFSYSHHSIMGLDLKSLASISDNIEIRSQNMLLQKSVVTINADIDGTHFLAIFDNIIHLSGNHCGTLVHTLKPHVYTYIANLNYANFTYQRNQILPSCFTFARLGYHTSVASFLFFFGLFWHMWRSS